MLTAVGLSIGLAITGVLLSQLYSQSLTRNIDAITDRQADALIARLLAENEASLQTLPSIDSRYTQANSGWYWQILDGQGQVVNVSTSAFGVLIPALSIPFDENNARRANAFDDAGNWLRIFERQISISEEMSFVISVTADWDEIATEVNAFQQQALLVLVAVGLLLATMCAFVARLSLGPLFRLSSAVEDIRNGRSVRLQEEFPKEVEPVKTEINALLDVNDKIMERAKNQVGDLAHGLKTPMAVMRNELGKSGSEFVGQQLDKMQATVSRYLDRAQLAARTAVRGQNTDTMPAAEKILSVMKKLKPENHIELIQGDAKIDHFRGDPDDFDEMLGNLVDNATKWASSNVRVTLRNLPFDMIEVLVEDDGDGLPDDKLETILERGRRLDQQVPGSGLGLGIVSELVSVYGGEIALCRSKLGGLCVTLHLPAVDKQKS
ncbi:ATP-binding protein [Maritalea sp.]|uniref:ATP-binding protein n=1 Tax=Maritalea sp. TaxID=2003361 RepID=UPI003EF2D02B